jgi:glycosyltransferase involved in cell wall biosynthesis
MVMHKGNIQAISTQLAQTLGSVFTRETNDSALSLVTSNADTKNVVDELTPTNNATIASDAGTDVVFTDASDSTLPNATINFAIENDYDAFISGWAVSSENVAPRIQVFCDNELVVETYATRFRPDLAEAGLNNGYAAFRCRVPASARGRQNVVTRVEADGIDIFSAVRSYSPLSVLIVSETEHLEDASRYYRCDNLRRLLHAEKIDATVIGPGEFCAKVWAHVDVIVFGRFGADVEMFDKIKKYKEDYGIKIIYEVDDLVFLPWHTFDLGSVRSGLDRADDPNLVNMFARRLRLLTLADGAITTTEKIAAHLTPMGISTKVIPNMVRPHEITNRVNPPGGPLRILCMAGSPTHYRDFQEIEQTLINLLHKYGSSIELTLLGRFRDDLRILGLPNATHIQRVSYPKMLQIIDKSDLCIVPLEYTEFNEAKSCLKFIECGARGVPVLASATADYCKVITDQVNGLVADGPDDWQRHLEAAVNGTYDLRAMGLAAQQEVVAKFNLERASLALGQFISGI